MAWQCWFRTDALVDFRQVDRRAGRRARPRRRGPQEALRRFWEYRDLDGGRVDTLHREGLRRAVARLEKSIKGLDCRRTFFLSYDRARHPHAHAVAFAQFLGVRRWASLMATMRH